MKNLSFVFALILSLSFTATNLNAQSTPSCCAKKTACKKTAATASSTATVKTVSTTKKACTATKSACAKSKTACSKAKTANAGGSDKAMVKQVSQTNTSAKKANCNPANCDPKNCDPKNCKPACDVTKCKKGAVSPVSTVKLKS
ncbi:MAG: hypothetical protein AB8F74_09935 [Saprospiraceae bacterium]